MYFQFMSLFHFKTLRDFTPHYNQVQSLSETTVYNPIHINRQTAHSLRDHTMDIHAVRQAH